MSTDVETENRILDAAHAVFVRRGTAGARMQEIAAEAGVNQALLHYYFRSKARLAEAVFQRAGRRLFPSVVEALASDDAIEDKVRRVVAIELETLSASPYLPGYILSEINHHPERVGQLVQSLAGEPAAGFAGRALRKVGAQIQERVRAGAMRPIAPEQFVVNLLSLCVFPFAARPLLAVVLGHGDEGFRRFIEERKRSLPDFFLAGLRP